MKRHPSLEPFSRDHNTVLILARRLADPERSVAALADLRSVWRAEMKDHFAEEERLLIPLVKRPYANRLRSDHRQIAAAIFPRRGQNRPTAAALSEMLERHVRWEERELFPAVENAATRSQLSSLRAATDAMEQRRTGSAFAGRRAELVSARPREPEVTLQDLSYLAQTARGTGAQWGFASEELNGTFVSLRSGESIKPHVNDAVDVLMMVVRGHGVVVLAGESYDLAEGDVLLLPKGQNRSILSATRRFSYFNVHRRRPPLQVLPTVPEVSHA